MFFVVFQSFWVFLRTKSWRKGEEGGALSVPPAGSGWVYSDQALLSYAWDLFLRKSIIGGSMSKETGVIFGGGRAAPPAT